MDPQRADKPGDKELQPPPAWKIVLFVLGSTTLVMSIFHVFPIFSGEGTGKVIDRVNVKNSGYKAVLEGGERVHFPPSDLWDILKIGDSLEKHRFSFIYRINGQDRNGLLSLGRMILHESIFIIVFFLVMVPAILWLERNQKR